MHPILIFALILLATVLYLTSIERFLSIHFSKKAAYVLHSLCICFIFSAGLLHISIHTNSLPFINTPLIYGVSLFAYTVLSSVVYQVCDYLKKTNPFFIKTT